MFAEIKIYRNRKLGSELFKELRKEEYKN